MAASDSTRYSNVTKELGNNKIRLQVKFMFIHMLICSFKKNMILIRIISRKIIRRNNDLFKVMVTKIKYSKSLQSKSTKGEIKTSFNFAVILCIYVNFVLYLPPSFTTRHMRVPKNYSCICYSLSFLLWFIALDYPLF